MASPRVAGMAVALCVLVLSALCPAILGHVQPMPDREAPVKTTDQLLSDYPSEYIDDTKSLINSLMSNRTAESDSGNATASSFANVNRWDDYNPDIALPSENVSATVFAVGDSVYNKLGQIENNLHIASRRARKNSACDVLLGTAVYRLQDARMYIKVNRVPSAVTNMDSAYNRVKQCLSRDPIDKIKILAKPALRDLGEIIKQVKDKMKNNPAYSTGKSSSGTTNQNNNNGNQQKQSSSSGKETSGAASKSTIGKFGGGPLLHAILGLAVDYCQQSTQINGNDAAIVFDKNSPCSKCSLTGFTT